jgi:RNA 2',3'-cyclic 3'-phosphodiesterase
MRLFVGVEVDARVRQVAERMVEQLRRVLPSHLSARWVPPDNLHLTVRFIGHVGDDRVGAIIRALTPPMDVGPFDVELNGCGRFPPKGPPRVLWIGISRGLRELTAIHDACNRRLAPLGFTPEDRPFSAHLTLARIKDAPPRIGQDVDQAVAAVPRDAVIFPVDHVTVFESRTSSTGSRYTSLARIPLRPTES